MLWIRGPITHIEVDNICNCSAACFFHKGTLQNVKQNEESNEHIAETAASKQKAKRERSQPNPSSSSILWIPQNRFLSPRSLWSSTWPWWIPLLAQLLLLIILEKHALPSTWIKLSHYQNYVWNNGPCSAPLENTNCLTALQWCLLSMDEVWKDTRGTVRSLLIRAVVPGWKTPNWCCTSQYFKLSSLSHTPRLSLRRDLYSWALRLINELISRC